MADSKNIYDSLDEVIARQKQAEERSRQEHEEILEAISRADAKTAQVNQVQQTVNQRNQSWSLKNFINRSVHEYMWFGTKEEFDQDKKFALILILSSIVSMIICTIVATVLFGIYSTFTLFENIWLVLMLCVLKYTYKTKKNYSTLDYSFNSFERFELDGDGVLRRMVYKKKYRWFWVLACIAFALNALSAWIVDETSIPLLVTVLELGTLAINIFTVYKVTDFFAAYGPIRFSGMNEAQTAKVVLVFDTMMNKLYTEEDYLKIFPFMK